MVSACAAIRRQPFAVVSMAECDGNALVARTGRNHQRYDDGVRLVAGCIPYRVKQALEPQSDTRRELSEKLAELQQQEQLLARRASHPHGSNETCNVSISSNSSSSSATVVTSSSNGVTSSLCLAAAEAILVETRLAASAAAAAAASDRIAPNGTLPDAVEAGAATRGVEECIEVLMITSQHGHSLLLPKSHGLLFPKGGWETDETAEEAACREAVEEAGVRGKLQASLGTFEFRSKSRTSSASSSVASTPTSMVGKGENGGSGNSSACTSPKEGSVGSSSDSSCHGLVGSKDGGAWCRAHVFILEVTEQLEYWPEKSTRHRFWLPLGEAIDRVRHEWMRVALKLWAEQLRTQPPQHLLEHLLQRQQQQQQQQQLLHKRHHEQILLNQLQEQHASSEEETGTELRKLEQQQQQQQQQEQHAVASPHKGRQD